MSRTVALIRVDLVLESPGGVTAPEAGGVADLPCSRDRDGAVWLPPSSLAGGLRAHFGPRAEQFFGAEPPAGKATRTPLQPSPVRFLGTATTLPPGSSVERRASTAVDPTRAAAAATTLRTRELLPAGTTITLYLRYDDRSHLRTEDGVPLAPPYDLDTFLTLVGTWRPRIGRGRATGHGVARVCRVAARCLDLSRAADLTLWLSAGRDELFPDADAGWERVATPAASPGPAPVLGLDFETVDALHVGSGSRNERVAEVLLSGGEPVIPATTWKGVLRARCGYILRSCGQPACLVPGVREGDEREVACRTCQLCGLFGWSGDNGTPGTPTGQVGRLTFHDSKITGRTGRRNHVGIDRFTGGARRHLLFADQAVTGARFTLRVTMTRRDDELRPADRGLLLLAVRDLHDGFVGIGRSTTRGYGTVRLTGRSRVCLDELDPDHETGAAVLALLRGATR